MRIFSERGPRFSQTAIHSGLRGKRVFLRPLTDSDYEAWREVRIRCREWLVKWEPRLPGNSHPEPTKSAFKARIGAAQRDREFGIGYGFGIFVNSIFVGEITLGSIQRSAFQSGTIGYWIDKAVAGKGYMPEAVVLVLQFAFENVGLHRVEINIVPFNRASLRVVEKLNIRYEGTSKDYLLIDGLWRDHARFAITEQEWWERKEELLNTWIH